MSNNKKEQAYTKDEILSSKKYKGVAKDIISAILLPNKMYTLSTVDNMLKTENKRVIK